MADAVKPCPFCGGDDLRVQMPTCRRTSAYDAADRAFPQIVCQRCGVTMPGDNWDCTGMSAIAAWNRRTAPEREGGA